MTIHANRRVIRVPTHVAVTLIRIRLVRVRRIARVACVDAGEDRVIRRIDMAVAATRTVMRNPERRMVKDCPEPCRSHPSGVARNASRRIVCRDVIRRVGPIGLRIRVIRLMAAVAIRRRIAGGVVAANVAVRTRIHHRPNRACNGRAWRQHVRTLERESRCRVVKLSVGPQNRVVARRTHGSREASGNVVWHAPADCRRTVPRRLVASITIRVRRRKVVVVSRVAICAGNYLTRWR